MAVTIQEIKEITLSKRSKKELIGDILSKVGDNSLSFCDREVTFNPAGMRFGMAYGHPDCSKKQDLNYNIIHPVYGCVKEYVEIHCHMNESPIILIKCRSVLKSNESVNVFIEHYGKIELFEKLLNFLYREDLIRIQKFLDDAPSLYKSMFIS